MNGAVIVTAVSTVKDLGILATALLRGNAPGTDALTATAFTDQGNTAIGAFWRVSQWQTGQTIVWHNGQTAGYTSYLGLDRAHHTAVIVLSDVAVDPGTTNLGTELLAPPLAIRVRLAARYQIPRSVISWLDGVVLRSSRIG